jgi:hypothetical protein
LIAHSIVFGTGRPFGDKGELFNFYFIKKKINVDTLWSLVEKTEAHVIIRLLLLLFLLLLDSLFGGTSGSTTSSGGTTSSSTTSGDGGKLGSTLLNQLKFEKK